MLKYHKRVINEITIILFIVGIVMLISPKELVKEEKLKPGQTATEIHKKNRIARLLLTILAIIFMFL